MPSSRVILLRASSVAASPRALRPACGGLSALLFRTFSISRLSWLRRDQGKSCSHEFPTFTKALTTREYSALKPGTEFDFHKIPSYLIPRGWTNDPRDLEVSLKLNLHLKYASFPRKISPVLSFTANANAGCWAHLFCEGSDVFDPDFYLALSDYEVYRLDTKIELMPLLACMKELADHVVGEKVEDNVLDKKGGMPYGLKELLEHPDLEWYELGQDELTEVTLMIKSMPVPTLSKPPSTPTLPQICGLPLTPTYLETALHKTTSLVKKVDCGVDTVMSVSE